MRRVTLLVALALGAACGGKTEEPVGSNPRRLWFSGPESSLRLSAVEPTTPF
jgi:hypothetical protein